MKENPMPSELLAAEIEKVLGDWYCDLALDTGLDFAKVAETIAARVRERQRAILPADAPAGVASIGAALGTFHASWLEASPLVRASVAGWFEQHVARLGQTEACAVLRSVERGLERRGRIAVQSAGLFAAISDLFVALCREADDEADRLGVPGDARP